MSLHISGVGRRESQRPKATVKMIKMKFLGVLFFWGGSGGMGKRRSEEH